MPDRAGRVCADGGIGRGMGLARFMWRSSGSRSRTAAVCSAAGSIIFVVTVIVEHVVDRSLNPATHEISEYVHGPLGGLMVAGFIVWGLSLAAAALAVVGCGRWPPVAAALLLAAIGLMLTAAFATQTSAGQLPPGVSLSMSGRLHDIGSGVATLALALAVLLSLWLRIPRALRRTSVLVLVITLAGDGVLLLIGPSVAGMRQRLLVGAACVWQLTLTSFLAWRAPRAERSQRSQDPTVTSDGIMRHFSDR
jgi:Protein of unknown function (DUF998)